MVEILAVAAGGGGSAGGEGSLTLLIIYIAVALGISFLCSVMEAVLLSVSPAYIGALEADKPDLANRWRELKKDVDRPLAAILTLNTVAHTVGAIGAGAEADKVFGSSFFTVFTVLMTLAVLVLSEIIPKTLGATFWRRLAPFVAALLKPLILVLLPLVWMSQLFARMLTGGSGGHHQSEVSREELAALADIGAEEGVFEDDEARMFKSLLSFKTLQVRDVMTPRTVVVSYPETATVDELVDAKKPFSRYPLYSTNNDDITGYALLSDALSRVADDDHDTQLSELRRDLIAVPEDRSLLELFDEFVKGGEHIALVVDSYGGTAGVATMEDVIETLIGLEITDETDKTEDMQALAREQWRQRAERFGLLDDVAEEVVDELAAEASDSH